MILADNGLWLLSHSAEHHPCIQTIPESSPNISLPSNYKYYQPPTMCRVISEGATQMWPQPNVYIYMYVYMRTHRTDSTRSSHLTWNRPGVSVVRPRQSKGNIVMLHAYVTQYQYQLYLSKAGVRARAECCSGDKGHVTRELGMRTNFPDGGSLALNLGHTSELPVQTFKDSKVRPHPQTFRF